MTYHAGDPGHPEAHNQHVADLLDLDGRVTTLEGASPTSAKGVFNVMDYGAVADGKVIHDGAMTSGSAVLTSASNKFTSGDVGKAIVVNGAATGPAPFVTTISAFTNSGSVTLAANATRTVSGADCMWGTDDADAIRTALYAGINAGVADDSRYAEIHFPAGIYVLSSAAKLGTFDPGVTGADDQTWGNSLIPLPMFPETGPKFVLAMTGVMDAASIAWYQQDRPHVAGAVLAAIQPQRGSVDGTWFEPSVIGAATRDNYPNSGGATPQSNMKVNLSGLQVVTVYDAGWDGFNMYNVAQLNHGSLSATVFAHVGGEPNVQDRPTRGCVGMRYPRQKNNDEVNAESFTAYGYYYGWLTGDHFVAQRLLALYCNTAWLTIDMGGTWYHGAHAQYVSVEACGTALDMGGASGGVMPLMIDYLDMEAVDKLLNDGNNCVSGNVFFQNGGDGAPVVTGGGQLRLISLDLANKPGGKTPPSVPATTVALKNPFWRDCMVTVKGGTVTDVTVDGVSLGATPGTVSVPSGKSITLTYSSAPTWAWIAQ